MTNLDSIKQRHHFAKECPSSRSYGFSSSHVWTWELDNKESWAPKNWCFWTVVLEKALESPLDCKEIQPINPKENQSWIFIGRTDSEAETPILWPPDVKEWVIGKDPDAGKDWRREKKGMTEHEMVGWHHWLNLYECNKLWVLVMDREAWHSAVHGVAKSRTWLSDRTELSSQPSCFLEKNWQSSNGIYFFSSAHESLTNVGHILASKTYLNKCCSVVKSCTTLFDPTDCSIPGFPVLHYLLEFAQIHVHCVGDSNDLILCHPLLLLPSIFPSIRVFSVRQILASGGQNIGASASALPMNIQGCFPFRIEWFHLLAV